MAPALRGKRSVTQDHLAEYFQGRQTRAGVLGRHLLGTAGPADAALAEHLIRERQRRTRLDGSVDGTLIPSAWLVWELLELGAPLDDGTVVRVVGFLLGRQDQPGRIFGEGCRPYTHERGWCSHYLGGFFSAGPEESPIAPLTLPTGVAVPVERDARFAASCFALRAVIRAGHDRREGVHRHVSSLLDLTALWSEPSEAWSPDTVFSALGAIALAPLDLRQRAAQAGAQVIARQQRDGSWPGADPFHTLDMLLLVPTAEARAAVRRVVPLADSLIQERGTLEGESGEERALIAVRAITLAG